MSDIEVTVRGSFTAYAPAERATVQLVVQREGAAAKAVLAETVKVADVVRASIERLHAPSSGPVTWWSSQQLHTWSHRPWNKDGKVLPLVHGARVGFEVKFADFAVMGSWMTEVTEQSGATVNGIEWALTAKRREALVEQVRVAAVRDALSKARTYASAFGLAEVRAIAVADAGMLLPGLDPTRPQGAMFARAAADAGGGGDPQFAPRDIAVVAEVDVRFVAG